jgi:lipopolysaccharide export system protein LptA
LSVSRTFFSAITFALLAPAAFGGLAFAQTPGFGLGNGDQPVEIFADQGIEWHQDASAYVARGNARAIRGDTTVYGETLIAYYRKAPAADGNGAAAGANASSAGSGTQIYRVDADGNVRIVSANGTAYGDHAVYDVDKAILVMTGKNLRLVTERETITARDTLEYWQNDNMAVARGKALAVSDQKKIAADLLTAYFLKQDENASAPSNGAEPSSATTRANRTKGNPPSGTNASDAKSAPGADGNLDRMYAYGNVTVTTPEEVAIGDRGVYNARTGVAVLTGSVKITRDQNQLNGEAAEVNLNTNVSRILAGPAESSGSRPPVRALIIPEKKNNGGAGNEKPGAPSPTAGDKP